MASLHIAQKRRSRKLPSAGRVVGTVFWDCEGCILVDVLEKEKTINAAGYIQTLNKLRHALSERHPREKTVILQHDVRPHTARLTLQKIQKNGWKLLSHPPYSPDLAPSDYHLFRPLKDYLIGHNYENDEAIEEAVRSWLGGDGTDFCRRGIFKILQRWQKCTDRDGDFVEK
jgi:histone-lysine N-methyltransferase SETMAR